MVVSLANSCRPLPEPDRVDITPSHLEQHSRQRTPGRTGSRHPRAKVETTFITGAIEAAFLWTRHDCTRKVCARLAERDELAGRQTHEQIRLVLIGIGEPDCAADSDVVH